jgi:hypothetical protein
MVADTRALLIFALFFMSLSVFDFWPVLAKTEELADRAAAPVSFVFSSRNSVFI